METKKCSAVTAKGEPCKATAESGIEWCTHHDPARAAERQRKALEEAEARAAEQAAWVKVEMDRLTRERTELHAELRRLRDDTREASKHAERVDAGMVKAGELLMSDSPTALDVERARALIEWHRESRLTAPQTDDAHDSRWPHAPRKKRVSPSNPRSWVD